MKTATLIVIALALSGCSTASWKTGGICYVPFGVTGQCSVGTVEPGPAGTTDAPKPAGSEL